MKSNLSIVIGREFKERVAKKSFIITTLLMPVFMVLLMVAPAVIMNMSKPTNQRIAVVDESHIVLPALQKSQEDADYLNFVPSALSLDSIMADEKFDGALIVSEDIVENPGHTTLYMRDNTGMEMESTISGAIAQAVENQRLLKYNIANIDSIMAEVKVDSHLNVVRYEEDGSGESISSAVSMGVSFVMTFILYMFIIMYGQMVMTSIIEEKNNRVLELVVSSVKPTQLMMGKILGVGLVAVFQMVIWAVIMCLVSGLIMPTLIPADMSQQVAQFNAGTFNAGAAGVDPDAVKALAMLTSVGYIAKLFIYMLLFLVGGFLFYAAIFAAIGSAVDNVQDASQLQTFAIVPILIGTIFSFSLGNDPNGAAAMWLSFIPFTSSEVMLARVAYDAPAWQVWTSLALLYASFVGVAWIAGKIYRIGIFMYGKKPTVKDLARWARYK